MFDKVLIMNQSAILVLAIAFSSVFIVSGTNICVNSPCEPQINANVGKEFAITLESNPSTGSEWWTNFDPNYLALSNSTLIGSKKLFTFNPKSAGNTEVTMLLLEPWQNGTIEERKILPINIMSVTAASRRVIEPGKSTDHKADRTTTTPHNPRSDYGKDESVMETPMQASSH